MEAATGLVIATSILVGITAWYAYGTHRLAGAAKRQADANVRMAEEMGEQRLDLDRPYLLIEVRRLEQVEWQEVKVVEGAQADPCAAYPKAMAYRVHNAGRGPAKEIATTVLQPLTAFEEQKRDLLMPGEYWNVQVKASQVLALLQEGISGEKPIGIEAWMRGKGIDSPSYGAAYDCGLVALCTDIHNRRWATYLKFTLSASIDEAERAVTTRTLVPLEHRIVRLEEDNDPRSHRRNR